MEWNYELENMERSVEVSNEKEAKENPYNDEIIEDSNFDNPVKNDLTKEDMLFKIEENFNAYITAIDLFNLGEDVDELMNVIHDSFDINLAILESKFGVSKEEIKQYNDRRDELIKPYTNANKAMVK